MAVGLASAGFGRRRCSDRGAGGEVLAAGSRPPPPRELAAAPQWARRASGRLRELTSLSIGDGDEGDCWSLAFLGKFPSLSFSHTGFLKVGMKGIAGVGLSMKGWLCIWRGKSPIYFPGC
jgi:hypothetical protein